MKLFFWRPDQSETLEDAIEFEVKFFPNLDRDHSSYHLERAAQEYAEFYHDEYDGWDRSWPIELHIANENKVFLGKVVVEREMRPHFYGSLQDD